MNLLHALPPPLRHVAATFYGYRIRGHRYGPETPRLIQEANERASWSADRWKTWREERLEQMLVHAARDVPYYREQWAARRRRGDNASPSYLENWPVLEKEGVRNRARAFVSDGHRIRQLVHVHTSGTTGLPLELWWSRASMRAYYALREARVRHRYGTSVEEPWAILGGRLVAPVEQDRPPFWVWNRALHQLYMSSYHLSPEHVPAYLSALERYGVTHFFAYTSSLVALANAVIEGRADRRGAKRSMKVAITNAEPLLDHQREVISEAFDCPVCETYGMAEGVAAGAECEQKRLHLWPEVGWIEVEDESGRLRTSGSGDLICTPLLREEMPLIRYRVGDRASVSPWGRSCTCGSRLPVLGSILGRTDDTLYTRDGRRIGRLDPVFKGDLPIKEAQIVQDALECVRVRLVPDEGYTSRAGEEIAKRLRDRMGAVEVRIEEMDAIPRGSNGKFRAVVCNLPTEDRPTDERPAREEHAV